MPPSHRPRKTAMLVARRIVDDIWRNGHAVGDRLPLEKSMMQEYQIGRGTLREALRFLELQGVISLKPGPGGGPTLATPDASNLSTSLVLLLQFQNAPFRSVVEARVNLEPIMARLAAARLTADDTDRLTRSVDDMRANLKDREVFLQTNKDFHETIAWASGNQIFGFLVDSLIEIVDGTVFGVDYPENRRVAVLAAHDRILRSLLSASGDSSEESMGTHMAEYARYLSKKYGDVLGETVTWSMLT